MRTLYDVLSVSPNADTETIRSAYLRLAKTLHPDRHGDSKQFTERFQDVNRAFERLRDPDSRSAYDRELLVSKQRRRRVRIATVAYAMTGLITVVASGVIATYLLVPARSKGEAEPNPTAQHSAGLVLKFAPLPDVGDLLNASPIAPPVQPPENNAGEVPVREATVSTGLSEADAPSDLKSAIVATQPNDGNNAAPVPTNLLGGTGTPRPDPSADAGLTADASPKPSEPPAATSGIEQPSLPPSAHASGAVLNATSSIPGAAPASTDVAPPAPERSLDSLNWVTYRDRRYGFSIDYPAELFTKKEDEEHSSGSPVGWLHHNYMSRDGRARLVISTGPNAQSVSVAAWRTKLMGGIYRGATLEYKPLRQRWFVLAGSLGSEMFYERVTFSCERDKVHGWLLTYPAAERQFYSELIEEMHATYSYARSGLCREPVHTASSIAPQPAVAEPLDHPRSNDDPKTTQATSRSH